MLSKSSKDIKINNREVYRYLGYGKNTPGEDMIAIIDSCIQDVISHSELRSTKERFTLRAAETEGEFYIGDLKIKSKALAKNLKGCKEVYLFGATIGVGIDRLIARAVVTDVTKAAIYQAIGAAYIEDYCDYINDEIDAIACKEGFVTRPRFSPGYGDLSLDYQSDIAGLLNLPKNVGISLSESKIMSPSKSVTAIIGLKDIDELSIDSMRKGNAMEKTLGETNMNDDANNSNHASEKCRFCDKVNCQFREK